MNISFIWILSAKPACGSAISTLLVLFKRKNVSNVKKKEIAMVICVQMKERKDKDDRSPNELQASL